MKKRTLGLTILFLAIIIPLASAGLFDWFKKDIQNSPVNVGVNVQNADPSIITPLPDVIDTSNYIADNRISPVMISTNVGEVRFVVQDSNGIIELPGGTEAIDLATSVGEVAAGTANLEAYVTNPGVDYASTNTLATSCIEDLGCTNCGALPNTREYVCNFNFPYYFEPGTNTWTATVAVADSNDAFDTDSSKMFTIDSLLAYDTFAGLNWASISLSSTDQIADSSLGLTNRGNIDITQGDITGEDLLPSASGDDLPVDAFSVGVQTGGVPISECDVGVTADALIASTQVTITTGGAVDLPYGEGVAPSANAELLYFCIWDQLDQRGLSLISPSYTATGVNAWDLTLS